jgi:hypothetical protein
MEAPQQKLFSMARWNPTSLSSPAAAALAVS